MTAPGALPPTLHGLPTFADREGLAAARYGAAPGTSLSDPARPARRRALAALRPSRVRAAVRRALAGEVGGAGRGPGMTDPLLRTEPTADPDGIYQLLVDAHQGLDEASRAGWSPPSSRSLLANHIGDPAVIAAAVAAARDGVADGAAPLPGSAPGLTLPRGRGLAMVSHGSLPARSAGPAGDPRAPRGAARGTGGARPPAGARSSSSWCWASTPR